jgi:hypothetical protein
MRCLDGMCGDDTCERCFPRYEEDDSDDAYQKHRQEQTDAD